MTDNLIPCPFCGSKAELTESPISSTRDLGSLWDVTCTNDHCGANMVQGYDYEAIAAWNRRAQPDTQQLINVLEVAIARGEALGYEDEDYREVYKRLAGKEWSDDATQ